MPDFPQRPVAQLLGSNGPIHAVTYSASPSAYILTGSADRSIRLYNPSSTTTPAPANSITSPAPTPIPIPQARLIQTYSAHGYDVLSLAVASSNATFLSAGGDRAVFVWDVATAKTTRRLANGHTGRINTVTFAGVDDSLALSGGIDCTVRIWDLRAQGYKAVMVLDEAKDAVTSIAVGRETGGEILVGSVDGRVRGYDARMGRCVTDMIGASVTSLSMSRDGKTVLVGGLDSKMRLMDRRDGGCLRTYGDAGWRNEELRVQSLLGGKERWVVAGDEMAGEGGEGRVWAWDLLSGKVVAKVSVPWGPAGEGRKKVIGKDGKEKERKNVVSCIDWKDAGFGDQFCVGGTSGLVTVFGE
ncbi:WD40-repeat-containing domain protein [Podospora aff. communis PSN243]|uniref:WD40-repeat-containing domain protein n=1 Tax=Podospora aff. communis PSN243 TaxID=3040156 RepID=A0AAV9GU75_9PEZI|nr:WD40-repeat-containing domain protein [Podospora aff. communis PSN243]